MTQEQIEAVREQLQRSIDALAEPLDEMALAALDHLTKANEELRAEVELAKQEGVTETLQQIDCLTGGDGEYRLSTFPDRNCPDEDAMCKKIVARFDDLRATIDRLTKERDELRTAFVRLLDAADRFNGVFNCTSRPAAEYQGQMILAVRNAYEVLGIGRTEKQPAAPDHKEIADLRTRLSAMQEAIDKAVRRADAMDAPVVQWPVKHITEPLRPFATKPDTPSERIMSDKDRGNPVEGAHPMTKPEPEVDPLVAATQRLLQYEGHMVWCGHGNDDSKPCVCGLIDAQSKARDALAARNHTEGRTDG